MEVYASIQNASEPSEELKIIVRAVLSMVNDDHNIGEKADSLSQYISVRLRKAQDDGGLLGKDWAMTSFTAHSSYRLVSAKIFANLKNPALGSTFLDANGTRRNSSFSETSRLVFPCDGNTFVTQSVHKSDISRTGNQTYYSLNKVCFILKRKGLIYITSVPAGSPDGEDNYPAPDQSPENYPNAKRINVYKVFIVQKAEGANFSKVTCYSQCSEGERMSAKEESAVALDTVYRLGNLRHFYQARVPLKDFTKDDGESLVEQLYLSSRYRTGGESRFDVTRRVLSEYESMKEFVHIYPWFPHMLSMILANGLSYVKDIDSPLEKLSTKDAEKLGKALSVSLLTNTYVLPGVHEWVLRFPSSLGKLAQEYPWFESSISDLAQHLFYEVSWGVKARVVVGACISIVDALSDLLMVQYFFDNDQSGFGYANLAMVMLSVIAHALIGFVNNIQMKHHAKRSAVMQVLLSFVFLKPAMDAYRVTSGQKQEPGQIFSAITEVMISKMGETLFEAMPACSVQVYALLRLGGEIPIIMAVSILLSASTIALSTTIVSYDKDIGPKERSSMPHIYGYILNNPRYRFIVFVCMSAVSMIQVIVKSISVSLLALVSSSYVIIYFGIEVGYNILNHLYHGDFYYFPNIESPVVSIIFAAIIRFGEVLIMDYSALAHLRHPFQLGGRTWFFMLVWSLLSSFGCLEIYDASYPESDGKLEKTGVYNFLLALVGAWLFFVCVFLYNIDRKFIGTFYKNISGPDNHEIMFQSGKDEQILAIAEDRRSYRKKFEAEYKQWIRDNWARLEEEHPHCFNPIALHHDLPEHYFDGLEMLNGNGNSNELEEGGTEEKEGSWVGSESLLGREPPRATFSYN